MRNQGRIQQYVGQVERDAAGELWAVLYFRDEMVSRDQVRSVRQGKRRVNDLVLAAADNYPNGPLSPPQPSRLAAATGQSIPSQRLPLAVPHLV